MLKKNLNTILIKAWVYGSAALVLLSVGFIILHIFYRGVGVISMEFLFSSPTGMPLGTAGGIFPALMGTLGLGMICGLVASLLGVATAIYLRLYCQSARIESGFRIVIQCIAGIPSIVLGLFGYTFFVVSLQMGMSLMAGGLTLAIMIFPVVAVTTEKAIAEAEREQVLASYSLGASRAYTFFNLILPQCKSDILSGIILATAYAMGATAPIMLTASVLHAGVPSSLFNPVMALPYHLYILASEHLSLEYAYGTALVLVGLLLFIHGIAFALFLRTRSET